MTTYLIDDFLPKGTRPEDITDWSAIFELASIGGNTIVFPQRTYEVHKTCRIQGDGTKFVAQYSGAKPRIQFCGDNFKKTRWYEPSKGIDETSVVPCGIWAASKFRITGMRFTTDNPNKWQDRALLNFQRATRSDSGASEADMDSSVDDCSFSDFRTTKGYLGAGAINWMGRNMRIQGCVFSSGGKGNGPLRAISISYAQGDDKKGQSGDTGGHRKNVVRDCTFHLTKDSICIEVYTADDVDKGIFLHGLLVSGNIVDVGGTLIRCKTNAKMRGFAVTGNTCFRSQVPYIHFAPGVRIESSTISGNTFFNEDAGDDNSADAIFSDTNSTLNRLAITGNAFGRPDKACINLNGAVNRVAITGNTFDREDGQAGQIAIAVNSPNGGGVITGNASNLSTFTYGAAFSSKKSWEIGYNAI